MSFENKGSDSSQSHVVDLASFRKKKEIDQELARGGRRPLYVSHTTGKVTGSSSGADQNEKQADFGDRLQRIRSSLEKINRLMSELKKMSTDSESTPSTISSSGRSKL